MKNYNEMANDVFCRIEQYNLEKQRKRKAAIRTAVPITCLCLVVLASVGVKYKGYFIPKLTNQKDAILYSETEISFENTTESTTTYRGGVPKTEPFVYFCSLENGTAVKEDLIEPFRNYNSKIYLNFHSIDGLSEEQIQQEVKEVDKQLEKIIENFDELDVAIYNHALQTLEDTGYIVSKMSLNYFTLNLDNINNVKQIRITNASPHGQIDVIGIKGSADNYRFPHGKDLTIEKEQISEDICFSWNYYALDDYLKNNLTPSYSDFNDTFNFTVEYDDGTQKTASIDIIFNDSGMASIICNGYKTIKI